MKFDGDGIRVPAQRLSNGNLLIFGNGGKLAAYGLQSKKLTQHAARLLNRVDFLCE